MNEYISIRRGAHSNFLVDILIVLLQRDDAALSYIVFYNFNSCVMKFIILFCAVYNEGNVEFLQ